MKISIVQLHSQNASDEDLIFIGPCTEHAVDRVIAHMKERLECEDDNEESKVALVEVRTFNQLGDWFDTYFAYYSAHLSIEDLYK